MDIVVYMDSVVAWAIIAGITIVTLCRFAAKAIEEKTRYQRESEEFFNKYHKS